MNATEAQRLSIEANQLDIDRILRLIGREAKQGRNLYYVHKRLKFNQTVITFLEKKGFIVYSSRNHRTIHW